MVNDSLSTTATRTNDLFKNRAISQDRDERSTDNRHAISKNTVTAPKTYRKISRLNEFNGEATMKARGFEQTDFDQTGFDKFVSRKPAPLAKTTSLGEDWSIDYQKITDQLVSQINLCRFCYKLVERFVTLGIGSRRFKVLLSTIIKGKF